MRTTITFEQFKREVLALAKQAGKSHLVPNDNRLQQLQEHGCQPRDVVNGYDFNRPGLATWQVEGEEAATAAAAKLIARSAWFEVEPRPCNWFAFSVKAGEGHEIVFN